MEASVGCFGEAPWTWIETAAEWRRRFMFIKCPAMAMTDIVHESK